MLATSSGSQPRCCGTNLKRALRASPVSPCGFVIGVFTPPGCALLTRMPCGASSRAAVRVKPRTAYLLAAYAPVPLLGSIADDDEMLTMAPLPASCILGITACRPRKVPVTLTSSNFRNWSGAVFSRVEKNNIPALLTNMSMR